MPTVSEILRSAGLSDYEINSLDDRTTQAFGQVLSEAEAQKTSVDEFWRNTYSPGIAAWESERAELARKAAQAEAKAAYLERERESLKQSGLVTDDAPFSSRNAQGQFTTPGTPALNDPSEFVGKAALGLAQLSDIEFKYRNLYNAPLPVLPSQIVTEADRLGVSPMEYANRQFKFAEKEQQQHDDRIRKEVEERLTKKFAESSGAHPDLAAPRGSARFSDIQRATKAGERPDPTRMTAEQRRASALQNIHRAIEERERRDDT